MLLILIFALQAYNLNWNFKDKPFVIAGPCSAESHEQVFNTFKSLSTNPQINVFRAGIWKPRTRPDSFEGMGEKALTWLIDAKKTFQIPVAVEVANASHVESCLKYGIDMLWIGARSTVSPFTVQEIADSLKGVKIPVMIKNPVNPDLSLWIGAVERIQNSGIEKVAVIHRGFSYNGGSVYRNLPNWEIPIEFKRLKSDIPMLCDPSHITGDSSLIADTCQKAIDLNFDGFMIESHINPKEALSDAKQQVTPQELENILNSLTYRVDNNLTAEFLTKIESLRHDIDQIDYDVILKFAERMKIVREIGLYKKDSQVTILKIKRWEQIIKDRLKKGKEVGLSAEFIEKIMQLIHKESIRIQNEVMNRHKDEQP